MQSGKKPVNCIPCAKRKVRCDKRQPCYHCRRRRGDECVYQRTNEPQAGLTNQSPDREKLHNYIRHLGGDPALVDQLDEGGEARISPYSTSSPVTEAQGTGGIISPIGSKDWHQDSQNGTQSIGHKRGLVEHNEQVTYIEAPMWYSWTGVKNAEDEPEHHPVQERAAKPKSKRPHFVSALFDPMSVSNTTCLHAQFPPPKELAALWKTYLKNVHTLVNIFFNWEIEIIVRKAAQDPARLSTGEQALVLAICFIATLSLSETECVEMLHDKQPQVLEKYQRALESALLIAELIVTNDCMVLQAFILYLLAMRNRARPAASFSLMGIAVRIAERMGLHRDGDDLGLPILRSEERRRMWWQLQDMETAIGSLTGNIALTIYASWNTKLPKNLEDHDLHPDVQVLPSDRHGLTAMSHCLWRYQLLYMQRSEPLPDGTKKDLFWLLSPHVPLSQKDAEIDITERILGEKFLQHCEPVNPLHLHIQIGVRSFVLAARRVARQPALVNARISEMSRREREDYLGLCMKSLEYYLLSVRTETLKNYQWHSDNYLQWPSFVYVILEAHHRFKDNDVAELWTLIGRVYLGHPKLMTAIHHPDVVSIVQMTLVAWQRRHTHIQNQCQEVDMLNATETPPWIVELRRNFNIPEEQPTQPPDSTATEPAVDFSQLLPSDFDFDSIDWSVWEDPNLDASLYETDWKVN